MLKRKLSVAYRVSSSFGTLVFNLLLLLLSLVKCKYKFSGAIKYKCKAPDWP